VSLGKDYGQTVALRTLTCKVRAGEIVGLLGPNGAGKTTTPKMLLGVLRPSRGQARFLGLDCTRDARRVKERDRLYAGRAGLL
jgi:ABC-2 type transport system ATP-binding protein